MIFYFSQRGPVQSGLLHLAAFLQISQSISHEAWLNHFSSKLLKNITSAQIAKMDYQESWWHEMFLFWRINLTNIFSATQTLQSALFPSSLVMPSISADIFYTTFPFTGMKFSIPWNPCLYYFWNYPFLQNHHQFFKLTKSR